MSLVVYYAPMSSSARVIWALEELGVPYEKVKVDLRAGEQRKPEFLKLNPNGKVPALVVDGKPMFESLAMILYLGETYGVDKGLYPAPGPGRVDAYKWIVWGGVTIGEAVSRLLRNTSERFPPEEKNEKAAEGAKKDLASAIAILEDALTGREYLLGEGFTLVDLAVSVWVGFLTRIGFDMGPFPTTAAWARRCSERPAFARALQA